VGVQISQPNGTMIGRRGIETFGGEARLSHRILPEKRTIPMALSLDC
jgi:hypothetical protein